MMSKKIIFILLMVIPVFILTLLALVWRVDHFLKTKEYYSGHPVYTDRCYTDQMQPEMLEGLQIVSLSRHFHFPVSIKTEKKLTAYRFIAPENNNEFVKDWEKLPAKVEITGKSSTFKEIYTKSFPPGTWTFQPGGPVAASPLLFKANKGTVKAFYTTNYLFPEGIMSHKTKLLLIFSLILNYGFAIYFWLYRKP